MDIHTTDTRGGVVVDGKYRVYEAGSDLPFPIATALYDVKKPKFTHRYSKHPRG